MLYPPLYSAFGTASRSRGKSKQDVDFVFQSAQDMDKKKKSSHQLRKASGCEGAAVASKAGKSQETSLVVLQFSEG